MRFIRDVILSTCQVIRRARQTTLRVIGGQPTTDRLFSTWRTNRPGTGPSPGWPNRAAAGAVAPTARTPFTKRSGLRPARTSAICRLRVLEDERTV